MALEFTAALLFRSFVAQPFTIPASSMAPTVELGDYVVVAKFSYGYSNFSLPLGENLPAFSYAKVGPARGDVVVFRLPADPSIDYIKRVIGLPGDTVQVKNGIVHLNGRPLAREPAGLYEIPTLSGEKAEKFVETLPEGRSYTVMEIEASSPGDNTPVFEVPEGHYLVLGDNRDNSNDSRFSVGFVPEDTIIGKAIVAITWPDGKFTMRDIK
ncbi:signal peptidase I [Rhizobium sp.]